MKTNEPVTQKENKVPQNEVLITTTDAKGIITSANDAFINISGFCKDELIGSSHNIVRHPDMPPAAFEDLWVNLKKGNPWLGIVKNRSKNGDHYWVKAYVAPMIVNDKLTGYQSVRTQASEEEIKRANVKYTNINNGKRRLIKPLTIPNKLMLMIICSAVTSAAGYYFANILNNEFIFGVGLFIGCISAYLISLTITGPIKSAASQAKLLIDNPLSQEVITGRLGVFGSILFATELHKAKLNTFVHRATLTSQQLDKTTLETVKSFDETMNSISQQKTEIEMVAAAINEMSASIEEVTNNTNNAAQSATNAKDDVNKINAEISETIGIITSLEQDMTASVEVINKLAKNSQDIGAVLDVIQGIAEQTNLLALNAAIEAARAGEAGRGFAVVADEVRTLATRTADSTLEIEKIINQIQSGATDAVAAMDVAKSRVEQSFEHVENSAEAIASVTQSVICIENMNAEIATAASQQNAVSHDINRSIHEISESVSATVAAAEKTVDKTSLFADLSNELQTLVNQSSR